MNAVLAFLVPITLATVQIAQAAPQASYPQALLGEWLITDKLESCQAARERRPGQLMTIEAGQIRFYESTSVLQAIATEEPGRRWRTDSLLSSSDGDFPLRQVVALEGNRLTITKLADEQGPEFRLIHFRCMD